jgi:NAD(P)-dependent dehydrogenase (short-subunit alcohol dehydrogenase family)
MKITGKIVAVTGAASGIGAALCRAFHAAGAKGVAALDLDQAGANKVAAPLSGLALQADVGNEESLIAAIGKVKAELGSIDIFCSNAGVDFAEGSGNLATATSNQNWQTSWDVNVMAHVYAARALLPGMIERGDGYLVNVVSAAGLLLQLNDAAYTTTKHAALGFAESLATSHGDDGIKVSAVCPQYVETPLLPSFDERVIAAIGDDVISADDVAAAVLAGIREEQFLILPHPKVADYARSKTADHERWLRGMRSLRRRALDS